MRLAGPRYETRLYTAGELLRLDQLQPDQQAIDQASDKQQD